MPFGTILPLSSSLHGKDGLLKQLISNLEIYFFSAGQQGMTASKSFMAIWMRMTTERARAILKIHPEFRNLSDVEQVIFTEFYFTLFAFWD